MLNSPGFSAPPTRSAGAATEAYGRSVAILAAAEVAVRNHPSAELQRALLACSDRVIVSRAAACRALQDAGLRLPDEVVFWLRLDEELLKIPVTAIDACWVEPSGAPR